LTRDALRLKLKPALAPKRCPGRHADLPGLLFSLPSLKTSSKFAKIYGKILSFFSQDEEAKYNHQGRLRILILRL